MAFETLSGLDELDEFMGPCPTGQQFTSTGCKDDRTTFYFPTGGVVATGQMCPDGYSFAPSSQDPFKPCQLNAQPISTTAAVPGAVGTTEGQHLFTVAAPLLLAAGAAYLLRRSNAKLVPLALAAGYYGYVLLAKKPTNLATWARGINPWMV